MLTPAARWRAPLGPLVDLVGRLTPADLPSPPWALHVSATRPIGHSTFFGGPFVVVHDNEAWLAAVRRDVSDGPRGPRARSGALLADLVAMAASIGVC